MSDDVPPSGEEAKAQRAQTITPWLWAAVGVIAAAVFAIWLMAAPSGRKPQHDVIAPGEPPPAAARP